MPPACPSPATLGPSHVTRLSANTAALQRGLSQGLSGAPTCLPAGARGSRGADSGLGSGGFTEALCSELPRADSGASNGDLSVPVLEGLLPPLPGVPGCALVPGRSCAQEAPAGKVPEGWVSSTLSFRTWSLLLGAGGSVCCSAVAFPGTSAACSRWDPGDLAGAVGRSREPGARSRW